MLNLKSLRRCVMGSRVIARFSWRAWALPVGVALMVMLLALPAQAAEGGGGASLKINEMLEKVLEWLSGSLAITIGTIAMVAAAFVWMFLRHERGADFAFRALLGTAIAIGAANMVSTFMASGALL